MRFFPADDMSLVTDCLIVNEDAIVHEIPLFRLITVIVVAASRETFVLSFIRDAFHNVISKL